MLAIVAITFASVAAVLFLQHADGDVPVMIEVKPPIVIDAEPQ